MATVLSPASRSRLWLASCLLGFGVLVGCGSGVETADLAPEEAVEGFQAGGGIGDDVQRAAVPAPESPSATVPTVPQQRPRLIKRASLVVQVEDIDASVAAVNDLLTVQGGDLLTLSDQARDRAGEPRQVSLEMRVPQENLDEALTDLKALGTVQEQSITAEDVSRQLVDLRARIRNLRKSEEALLKIMERSGSIDDVLEVSRELSNVRETIERAEAQLDNLQNQVAFSTISLRLNSTARPLPITQPISDTLGETWQSATHSVRGFTVAGLQFLLWLLVYSPYLAFLLILAGLGYRSWRRHQPTLVSAPETTTPPPASTES